jgi:hypothetical protein
MYISKLFTSVGCTSLLLAAGCAYHNTTNGTVLGTAPLTWTFPVAAPPPAYGVANSVELANPPPVVLGIPETLPLPAADLSGVYSGTAVSTYNPRPASDCTDIAINRSFTVTGRQASFFAFNGTITPSGTLTMQAGDKWISGRFIGRTFQGELLRKYPACSWNLTLSAA